MPQVKRTTSAVLLLTVAASATAAQNRAQISIAGSSTVFPYTQAVAEEFANQTGAPSPVVESTGTGGGMQIFCGGIGEGHPDLTGASPAIKASEYELCQQNGVTDITGALIGFDGLSLAVSRAKEADWDLTLGEVYLALAAQVPVDGAWADSPERGFVSRSSAAILVLPGFLILMNAIAVYLRSHFERRRRSRFLSF